MMYTFTIITPVTLNDGHRPIKSKKNCRPTGISDVGVMSLLPRWAINGYEKLETAFQNKTTVDTDYLELAYLE